MNSHFKKIKHKYLAIINYFDGSTNIVRLKPTQVMEIRDVLNLDKYAYEVLVYEQRDDGKYEMINWSHKELDSDEVEQANGHQLYFYKNHPPLWKAGHYDEEDY